jgi:hypothetical protein
MIAPAHKRRRRVDPRAGPPGLASLLLPARSTAEGDIRAGTAARCSAVLSCPGSVPKRTFGGTRGPFPKNPLSTRSSPLGGLIGDLQRLVQDCESLGQL